jgi:hypothetical protein
LEIAERERDELRAELEKVRSEPMVAEFTLSVTQRALWSVSMSLGKMAKRAPGKVCVHLLKQAREELAAEKARGK